MKKLLTIINLVLTTLPFLFIGSSCAKFTDMLFPEGNGGKELMVLLLLIMSTLPAFLIHIIVHEAGHLVCGLLSGYKFLSFRVGSLTLLKSGGRLSFKKTTVAGTAGQCIMIPPDCEKSKDCPFVLYFLGGGLANFLLSAVLGGLSLLCGGVLRILLIISALAGVSIGINNLFPAEFGGMVNDGSNVFLPSCKGKKAKSANYLLLKCNAYFTCNEDLSKMPENLKNGILDFDYSDLSNVCVQNLYCYAAAIYHSEGDCEKAASIYRSMLNDKNVIGIFKNECRCECIYYELTGGMNTEFIDNTLDKKLAEYIKATAVYPLEKGLCTPIICFIKTTPKKRKRSLPILTK